MFAPESILSSLEFREISQELAETGRFLAERGWSPATSSNYSARVRTNDDGLQNLIAISRTGVDKSRMTADDFMAIDLILTAAGSDFSVIAPKDARPSAETLIHTAIYQMRPHARVILHTHSPNNTRLSLRFLEQGHLMFKGYELQKAIEGETHHDSVIHVPILANSQDMKTFAQHTLALLAKEPSISGFLIAGHGLYTWASTVATAKRHVEAFEFLFSCHALELMGV